MKLNLILAAAITAATVAAPAFAQRGGFGGFGFGGPGGGNIISMPEVQTELKLDPAQADLLKALDAENDAKRRKMFEGFRDISPEERATRMQKMRTDMEKMQADQEKSVMEILNPQQRTRYRQLVIQRGGTRSLNRKDVQDELKLTPDQRNKIQATTTAEGEAMRAMFQPGGGGGGFDPAAFQEMRKKMEDLRASNDAKMMTILTDPQKKQFQTMQGAPFKFPERQRGPRPNNN